MQRLWDGSSTLERLPSPQASYLSIPSKDIPTVLKHPKLNQSPILGPQAYPRTLFSISAGLRERLARNLLQRSKRQFAGLQTLRSKASFRLEITLNSVPFNTFTGSSRCQFSVVLGVWLAGKDETIKKDKQARTELLRASPTPMYDVPCIYTSSPLIISNPEGLETLDPMNPVWPCKSVSESNSASSMPFRHVCFGGPRLKWVSAFDGLVKGVKPDGERVRGAFASVGPPGTEHFTKHTTCRSHRSDHTPQLTKSLVRDSVSRGKALTKNDRKNE